MPDVSTPVMPLGLRRCDRETRDLIVINGLSRECQRTAVLAVGAMTWGDEHDKFIQKLDLRASSARMSNTDIKGYPYKNRPMVESVVP
jgi:hypothetical protein